MAYYLEMKGVTKTFPGVVANNHIDFSVEHSTIHALVGENGAGKTTLMRVLYGMYNPEAGEIFLDGEKVNIPNPQAAIKLGIGMVHQEFQLVPSLTVADNICLGKEPERGIFIDHQAMRNRVKELSEQFMLQINPDTIVADLPVGIQQQVEILKLLYREAELLILDEPTSVLTPQETDNLFEILKRLKNEGHTIILITHKLNEVKASCESATILRRGEVSGVVDVTETSEEEIVKLMMGRRIETIKLEEAEHFGPTKLHIDMLNVLNDRGLQAVREITFSVRSGEVVGIAGVEGNGQSELIETISGLRPYNGRIEINKQDISRKTPRQIREAGLAIIPEDRKKQGLNIFGDIAENVVSTSYYKNPFSKYGILNHSNIISFANKLIEQFNVVTDGPYSQVGTLSGGNTQKVVIARELAKRPEVLVVAHPTRGLDVGASQYVRQELLKMRREGVAILLISADLDEILSLSDRILVMFEGQIAGELYPKEADFDRLGLLMSGHHIRDAAAIDQMPA